MQHLRSGLGDEKAEQLLGLLEQTVTLLEDGLRSRGLEPKKWP